MLPLLAFGAGAGIASVAVIGLVVLKAPSLVGQNLLPGSCPDANNSYLNHSAQWIYTINDVNTPSSIGELLTSIGGIRYWANAEHEEVAAAFKECVKHVDDKKKAIQEFEGQTKDLVNSAVRARHQDNIDSAQANHDREVLHCKDLASETLRIQKRKEELSRKKEELMETEMGQRSVRFLKKALRMRSDATPLETE